MVEAGQPDRVRAATWASDQETAEGVIAGKLDTHPVVQAFAEARLEGIRLGLEAAAEHVEWGKAYGFDFDKAPDAIRALDPAAILRDNAPCPTNATPPPTSSKP